MADQFARLLADRPAFHAVDTEVGQFRGNRSTFAPSTRAHFQSLNGLQDYGISNEIAAFLHATIKPGMRTLETGSGLSTLIFALRQADHIAVSPSTTEAENIKRYADRAGIDLSRVTFAESPSEFYLPELAAAVQFDFVFIDGKHAFPWPMLDWFYTADRLKIDGLMALDDTQLPSVTALTGFLKADQPRWEFLAAYGGRTDVFRKTAETVHDVAWHEQPWMTERMTERPTERPSLARRALNRLKRKLGLIR